MFKHHNYSDQRPCSELSDSFREDSIIRTRTNPLKVLMVGGETGDKVSIVQHLQDLSSDIEILSATDNETVLPVLERQQVDIVLIDAFLSGPMNGFELCRAIRFSKAHQDLSIILLLAGTLATEHARAMAAGADLILHSPPVREELWSMVALLVKWNARRAQLPVPTEFTCAVSGQSFLKSA